MDRGPIVFMNSAAGFNAGFTGRSQSFAKLQRKSHGEQSLFPKEAVAWIEEASLRTLSSSGQPFFGRPLRSRSWRTVFFLQAVPLPRKTPGR